MYMGILDKTDLISVNLPAKLKSFGFHPSSLPLTLSTKCSKYINLLRPAKIGTPKYRRGNSL